MRTKKIAIMQPYFLPYIGYFQLINCVDKFVIYDNIEYTKKGWINRNRILANARDEYFTIPLKNDSDYLFITNRKLADNSTKNLTKIVNKVEAEYRKAPYYNKVFPILKAVFLNSEVNLFRYIQFSLTTILDYLGISTEIVIASEINIDHSLKAQDKVLAICEALKADEYINPIGGITLYLKEDFSKKNIRLSFIQSEQIKYKQFKNEFIPWLSIIDVMMFNSREKVRKMLNEFELQ